MPIDFPPSPSAGATYSYGGILWTYNGTAWDKTTASGSGNTGATGATGAQGEPGQSSNYYSYKVHTTTQTPPTGAGEIRYNNATQISSTVLYVDHLDNTGDDIDIFLSLLKQNDNLIIQDASDSNNYQTWRINSAPTVILNDYTSIPVTGITSAGTGTSGFANNHQVLFIVFSSPIATAYVESLRGLTGAIGLTNGNGIGISVSGNTLTFSNTGVLSFNGLTGAVTGVTVGGTNVFTALNTFNAGISAAGGITFNNLISVNGARFGLTGSANYLFGNINTGGLLTTGSKNVLIGTDSGSGLTNQTDNIAIGDSALKNSPYTRCVAICSCALLNNTQSDIVAIGSRAGQSNTGLYVVAVGSDAALNNSANTVLAIGYNACGNNAGGGNMGIGPFALCNNTNSSASQNCALGNNALFANSGARNVSVGNDTLVGGAGYVGQSGSRNAVIGYNAGFNNTSGSDNVFIGNQAGYGNSSGNNNVFIGSGACGSTSGTTTREIVIGSNAVGLGSNTAVIGATSQTSATIYGLLNAPSGLSASGITVGGSIVLQNAEFIRNTTDGRIDFLPGPVSGTTYGLYMHFTNWGAGLNGVQFGTITSSTGVLDAASILYGTDLVIANTKKFSFGSSQRYQLSYQLSGGVTSALQLGLPAGVANDSASLVLMDYAWVGNANRIPVTAHTNPNLYVYRSGSANANDFIRIEHNGTNGLIVSGGTSGISIEPGSGVVGISGGISVSGITFQDGTFQNTAIPHMVLFNAGII